jgi:hypothetical protein
MFPAQKELDWIVEKAQTLGIDTEKTARHHLIRTIQAAEGNTPCFGDSNGGCQEAACCFRQECLGTSPSHKPVDEWKTRIPAGPTWAVTLKGDWLRNDVLIVPPELAGRMVGTNTVHVLYDDIDEVLPYEQTERLIEGVGGYYTAKKLFGGDEIRIELQSLNPTRLRLSGKI